MIDRRTMLALSAVAGAAATFRVGAAAAQASGGFTQPKLPYAENALQPAISARTVGLHYGKHHKAYFDKLNTLTKDTPYAGMSLEEVIVKAKADGRQDIFNNAGQAWNHNFYWQQFADGPKAPSGAFLEAVKRDFGGVDEFKAKMTEAGDKVFGTGWVWLVADKGKLEILSLQDAGNPIAEGKTPLAGLDVWEHAYYLDYENRRPEHLKAAFDIVNWDFVGKQMAG
jgi:superoxide dismutase, Fe-Mn family